MDAQLPGIEGRVQTDLFCKHFPADKGPAYIKRLHYPGSPYGLTQKPPR